MRCRWFLDQSDRAGVDDRRVKVALRALRKARAERARGLGVTAVRGLLDGVPAEEAQAPAHQVLGPGLQRAEQAREFTALLRR